VVAGPGVPGVVGPGVPGMVTPGVWAPVPVFAAGEPWTSGGGAGSSAVTGSPPRSRWPAPTRRVGRDRAAVTGPRPTSSAPGRDVRGLGHEIVRVRSEHAAHGVDGDLRARGTPRRW